MERFGVRERVVGEAAAQWEELARLLRASGGELSGSGPVGALLAEAAVEAVEVAERAESWALAMRALLGEVAEVEAGLVVDLAALARRLGGGWR